MTDLTTLQSLRDRVANATGPDRELDSLFEAAGGRHPKMRECRPASVPGYAVGAWGKSRCARYRVREYTSSVDAALTWVERVFPGSSWSITKRPECYGAEIWEYVEAASPAIAIILAGLDALIAKEKTDGTA